MSGIGERPKPETAKIAGGGEGERRENQRQHQAEGKDQEWACEGKSEKRSALPSVKDQVCDGKQAETQAGLLHEEGQAEEDAAGK